MGYGMSRLDEEYSQHEGQNSDGPSSVQANNEFLKLHNDIFQMTRIKSGPSESIRKSIGTSKDTILTTRLLSGREVNSLGNGKFSSVDRAFVLGRYLPVDDPEIVDRMDSQGYVSQFSADGSLFVAGFQMSQYDDLHCYTEIYTEGSYTEGSELGLVYDAYETDAPYGSWDE